MITEECKAYNKNIYKCLYVCSNRYFSKTRVSTCALFVFVIKVAYAKRVL